MSILVLFFTFILGLTSYAQDMSRNENFQEVYISRPDGSSVYRGRCMTHEDYEGFYFKSHLVIQNLMVPKRLSNTQLMNVLVKFDQKAIALLFKVMGLNSLDNRKSTEEISIFRKFIDDFRADYLYLRTMPSVKLIRFNVGVGGGNGAHVIMAETFTDNVRNYKLISYTFDGDLNYCDRLAWR